MAQSNEPLQRASTTMQDNAIESSSVAKEQNGGIEL
jgi:hypothetical protein